MSKTAAKDAQARTAGLRVERRYTTPGVHPFDEVEWELRDAVIGDPESPAFEQRQVEFPTSWSQNATNIVAQKYFRGKLGSPERERSVKQMISRVAGTIAAWGREAGYFAGDEDANAFEAELTDILLHQRAAFNSPVWFNVGFEDHPQCSACFILSVQDTMESILDWNTKEGMIFRGGSGSGINLSNIRSSKEHLSKGGLASGPVSFMRGADAWAGTIKSGGKTRRAAKMVVLDVDHPDVEDFISCKANEEKKAAALRDAGFDMRLDSDSFHSIQYQNANNSVRVTDEFMEAVERGDDWDLTARTSGEPLKTLPARELMGQIADAAWRCADPGVQYDTTINHWHTCPESGRINASNPCSEYMHVDDSACNLASINLMKFRNDDGSFDVEDFCHVVDVIFLAQEIVVGPSSYPTEEIGRNARAFRQIGLGYANLGALLMSNGLPYDSEAGRAMAAAITALMTGRAYRESAEIAAQVGTYDAYAENHEPHNAVMRMHRDAAGEIDDALVDDGLLGAARKAWDEAVALGDEHGYRNAQATVLAPTGTISFLMDCDTTGIEPDFSLVKFKELVGGGQMTIVNRSVPLALRTLGYSDSQVEQIEAHINEKGAIVGAPELAEEHLPVFDVAVGGRAISHLGHIEMMSAVQPFISGAISKTVNLPESASVDDIADAYTQGWKLGLKALAIYRDGSKTAQALRTDAGEMKPEPPDAARARVDHPQVLDRRPRGLHHRRQVRGRLGRRDLSHRHRQGGLDPARDDERVRDRDLDRAPVRRPARGLRAQVQLHALRPRGDHEQPRDPVREVDARLPDALAGEPVHRGPRRARGPRHPDPRGQGAPRGAAEPAARRRHRDQGQRLGRDERRQWQRPPGGQRLLDRSRPRDRRPHRHPAGDPGPHAGRRPRSRLRAVRRDDAAHRLLLHLHQLREQHGLRVGVERHWDVR
jgi:ribonucleoside-diphosphate reductase alpha chain